MTGNTIETLATEKADGDATKSHAAIAHFQDLTSAYQSITAKNVEKLTASISALTSVKEPVEFLRLQHKFMTEAMNEAVADSAHIIKLTAAAFTAAFKPM